MIAVPRLPWTAAAALSMALACLAGGAAVAEEIPPDRWLDCYAATRLRQEAMRADPGFRMQAWMAAGEPRIAYYRLVPFYLVWAKKARPIEVEAVMNTAAEQMKRTRGAAEIDQLARTCTENLPPLGKASFYDRYPWLRAETAPEKKKPKAPPFATPPG